MARVSGKRLWIGLPVLLLAVVTIGYVTIRRVDRGAAESAESAADSAGVASADSNASEGPAPEGKENGSRGKKKKNTRKEPDPVPVEVATVRPGQISSYYHATATLEPERTVELLAKVAGEVESILVEEGARVKKGEVLCRLEGSELRIILDEMRINRDQQRREYERLQAMHREQLVSDTEFADRQYQYELAENKYQAAALKLERTRIRAPFAGVITRRLVELGQNINTGSPLFELVDPDPLLIRMYLPENQLRDIEIGQEMIVSPDSDPGHPLAGRIVRIAPRVDGKTGTVKVTAETRGGAMPGSFARIKIVTDTRRGTLTIPRRGLVSDAGELFVYVAEADSVRKSPVKIGYQDENFAEVLGGIDNGDRVVVVGMGGLRTGTRIKILDPSMQDALSRKDDPLESRPATN